MTGFSNSGGGGSSTPGTLTIPGQSYVPAAYGPATNNTRRGVLTMGGEGDLGLVTPTNSDVCQRYGFTVPGTGGAPIARFRFRLRNSNLNANTSQAGAITLGAFAIGTPNVASENSWSGDFTAVPTTVVTAPGSTELGSSEYVSPWVSPATFTLTPNTFYGLTLGFTCAGVQVNQSDTPGWSWVGTGSAAANLLAAAPGTTPQPYVQYLDLRMEYEFAGTNEIGLFIGDSITSGWLNTASGSVAAGHMGPDNTWPHQAALRLGHHDMNAGVGGGQCSTFTAATPATNLAWSRFLAPESGNTVFASAPDYCNVALGLNDSLDTGAGTNLANFQSRFRTIGGLLTALGVTRVYASTATPGYTGPTGASTPSWQAGQLLQQLAGGFSLVTVGTAAPAPLPLTITAATNASTTITATVLGTGGIFPGQIIMVQGASGGTWANIIGKWVVTAVTATTVQFVVSVAPTGSYTASTGTLYQPNVPAGPGGGFAQPGSALAWKSTSGVANLFIGTPQNPVTGGGPIAVTLAVGGGIGGGNGYPVFMAASGTATAPVGTPVLTACEYYRQAINLWLRSVPPGVQSTLDFDADVTTQFYYPSSTGRPEYYNNAGDVHPTTPAMYSLVASRFVNGILGN